MNDFRDVRFALDKKSWPISPPTKFCALEGNRQVDLLEILLNIAWYSAPPRGYGFELAYGWACLRYYAAFDVSNQLSICTAYEDQDPHQKTILSDDMGVGFGTYVASEVFKPLAILPTLFFVKLLRHHTKFKPRTNPITLVSDAKTGKQKSPDFLVIAPTGVVHVLECKGTQTPGYLGTAMKEGVAQKASVKLAKSIKGERFVSGVYLQRSAPPHAGSSVCRVADPPVDPLEEVEGGNGLVIDLAVRCELARFATLLGLSALANDFLFSVQFSQEAVREVISLERRARPRSYAGDREPARMVPQVRLLPRRLIRDDFDDEGWMAYAEGVDPVVALEGAVGLPDSTRALISPGSPVERLVREARDRFTPDRTTRRREQSVVDTEIVGTIPIEVRTIRRSERLDG